jgi:beta-ribofuranosylaminobenzene 5'-phosphate synthase
MTRRSPRASLPEMTNIVGYPRLHFGLFDLGSATQRIYGGIGAAIDGPTTTVAVVSADATRVEVDATGDAAEFTDAVTAALERLTQSRGLSSLGVQLQIRTLAPAHVGLGTKTTVVLAALTAVSTHLGLGLTRIELQRLSGRGGTSGVGVNSFFTGGLIVDGGHKSSRKGRRYAPSAAGPPERLAPVLVEIPMPSSWVITLGFPKGNKISGHIEEKFFANNTPISSRRVHKSVSIALLGIAAAIADSDLGDFSAALHEFQQTGFKLFELGAQPASNRAVLEHLTNIASVAAGMSSMGPLLFAVTDRADVSGQEDINAVFASAGVQTMGPLGFRNMGYDFC